MPATVGERQIAPTAVAIAGQVLPEVGELKSDRRGIGQRAQVLALDARDAEDHAPHRRRAVLAVLEQRTTVRIAMEDLVAAIRFDEPEEELGLQRPSSRRTGQGDEDGRIGGRMTREGGLDPLPPGLEQHDAITLGLVTEVVGRAAERVDRRQIAPLGGQQKRPQHGKVLVVGMRQLSAFLVSRPLVADPGAGDGTQIRHHERSET